MLSGVDAAPGFFSQPLEVEDRKGIATLSCLCENVDNLLRDGTMLSARAGLNFPVEAIGKIFYIERRHVILNISSIMEEIWRIIKTVNTSL
jgi:hypothetical protein